MKNHRMLARVLTVCTVFGLGLGTAAHATTISAGTSSTVSNGGTAPGSSANYDFFGNVATENGGASANQPVNLTNFTVDPLANVVYQGNGNYTRIVAPGGSSAFTTGILTEVPANYPNTTPHTDLLATFSPDAAGSFTVYILDANTDGIFVGNSSVGLGVNGGAEVATASNFTSGTNEFTKYTVTNALSTDVFQVYATTNINNYPSIGGLTFSAVPATSPVPEPSSISLCLLGLSAGASVVRRMRR
ncbi:MAG TPA: PEP-CTERM sorting domain-containing protein [Acidobacteriaceae bacterium]|nr:PEP-CTERM sorting domain-containing protein [Acidobacteriaceae bacterium]